MCGKTKIEFAVGRKILETVKIRDARVLDIPISGNQREENLKDVLKGRRESACVILMGEFVSVMHQTAYRKIVEMDSV